MAYFLNILYNNIVMCMYSNEIICKILEYIDNNINKKITIEELSLRFYYNRFYIMKLFKKEIGISLFDYINSLRIYNSINSINNSDKLLIRIAIDNGFYSLEYFSEMFKKIIGVSPSIYKKFYYRRFSPSKSNYKLITDNIIKLNMTINKVNKYKQNVKPQKLPIRKLSIFN